MEFKRNEIGICVNCGKVLTEEEIEYYDDFCEECEYEMHTQLMEEMYRNM